MTTAPNETVAAVVPPPQPLRRRGTLLVVVALLALVAVGAVDWAAYRFTHISMHGVGGNGGESVGFCSNPSGAPNAVTTRGLALGIGIYGVERPGRVTFSGVTAISPTPNLVIDHAFLIPGVLLGDADAATLPSIESTYQLQHTVVPGGQIFSIPPPEQTQPAGDRWNLIVVLRTTDPTQPASAAGFKVTFSAPWRVALTDTSHTSVAFTPNPRCGTP